MVSFMTKNGLFLVKLNELIKRNSISMTIKIFLYFRLRLSWLSIIEVIRKGPIFPHDNARPHVSMITRQKFHTLNYEVLDHSPYLPDLLTRIFSVFQTS